jgi:hypothetical protein
MLRYYSHVKRGQLTVLDQVGIELADFAAATAEALERGRQIAASETLRALPTRAGLSACHRATEERGKVGARQTSSREASPGRVYRSANALEAGAEGPRRLDCRPSHRRRRC